MTLVTRPSMADDDGTFTSGTEVDKAFIDDILDEIDDQAHSTTNPTVKPKATTDEVVAARGSKASLDARLDVALNEDGTLRTQASLVTLTDLQGIIGSRNVAVNGDMEDWSAGGSAAPDSFTLTTLTIARTGPAMGDTFTFGAGTYAAKLTRAGADGNLKQTVIAGADIANYANVKGQKVSAAVKIKTSIASHARVTVDDGVTTTSSSFHTGGGTEEHLTVTHQISNSATKLEVLLEVMNSAGDAYFGGLVITFTPYAAADWQALSVERDASETRRGLVGTGTQTFGGVKNFGGGAPLYEAGGGASASGRLSGRLNTNTTPVGNVGAGTDDLMTYTLPGGSLNNDGMALRITAFGTFAANANNKTLAFVFGATSITFLSASAQNNRRWKVVIELIRTGAATQKMWGICSLSTGGDGPLDPVLPAPVTPAETLSGNVTLKFTGLSGSSVTDDIIQDLMIVETIG